MKRERSAAAAPAVRKRASLALIAAMLVIGAAEPTHAAGAKKERRATARYLFPAPAVHPTHPPAGQTTTVCVQTGAPDEGGGCVFFPTRPGERFVDLEVRDATGLPVQAFVAIEDEGQGDWRPFCGETDEPLRVYGTVTVIFYAYTPVGLPPCPGAATTGSVEAVFSRSS